MRQLRGLRLRGRHRHLLLVEEKELEVDFATDLGMEERNVKEILSKKRSATFLSVQLTVIEILGRPGTPVAKSAGEEQGRECGLAFNHNLKGKSAMEVILRRMNATLGPVRLIVSGVPGTSGVAATDNVVEDINPDSGPLPRHNMEAILVGEILGRGVPATLTPVHPSHPRSLLKYHRPVSFRLD